MRQSITLLLFFQLSSLGLLSPAMAKDCADGAQCGGIDQQYSLLLEEIADEYQHSRQQSTEHGHESDGDEDLFVYTITDKHYLAETTARVEQLVATLIPKKRRRQIASYRQESDGNDGMLAYVMPINRSGSQWQLTYDAMDTFDELKQYKNIKEFVATLIHEYAHIETLNRYQVKHQETQYAECLQGQVVIDEGCALTDSYLHEFVKRFWKSADRSAAYLARRDRREEGFAYAQYKQHPSRFVSEYAATNAVEDLAESFSFFVLREAIKKPSTLAEEKIDFFYRYPDMVELRQHIRTGLAKVLANPK